MLYTKLYVDEVQDYTQAEILLLYHLSGTEDPFFCGDSAQSIVEGAEFSFKVVRSVPSFVAGPKPRHLVPQRSVIVNVNFRRHAGIMNVAAAVLSRMFAALPRQRQTTQGRQRAVSRTASVRLVQGKDAAFR
jgi:superfamily I DNA/RNA helicase